MTYISPRIAVRLSAVPLCLAALQASAHDAPGHGGGAHHQAPPAAAKTATSITIENCWIRPLPGNLPAAAYLRIVNQGSTKATLVDARSDAYGRVMLHATETRNGMASMKHVHALDVPAGEAVDFSPGGYHVMLHEASQPFEPGDEVELVLEFGETGTAKAACEVKTPDALS